LFLQEGLDLNPVFTGSTSFRPAGEGGELKLFEQVGIELVHGWLVDPDSDEYHILQHVRDYDTAVTLIADADHITRGRLLAAGVWGEAEPEAGSSSQAGSGPSGYASPSSPSDTYSDKDREKIEHGMIQAIYGTFIAELVLSTRCTGLPGEHEVSIDISWSVPACVYAATRLACGALPKLTSVCIAQT
jgi:hypothetical protein